MFKSSKKFRKKFGTIAQVKEILEKKIFKAREKSRKNFKKFFCQSLPSFALKCLTASALLASTVSAKDL